jgi:hypothetical protein
VTDVEHAAQLGVELCGVGEIGIAPRDRMACRGFQAAFAHVGYQISGIRDQKKKIGRNQNHF